ncbi:MAG: cyclase/dehydrase [Gammaproteobacteria bacterium]|nr:cyclase/dehydrase [Gammaproteobacteria bacterium]
MTEPLKNTTYGDAPLSAAKNPDARATLAPGEVESSDTVIGRTVTINRPRHELYEFWRDFRNLPLFMREVQQIEVIDRVTSLWTVAAPGGKTVEWESLVTEEKPDEVIAWESSSRASVRNSGRVEFRDGATGRGTEVTATIVYDPPAGSAGKLIAKLFQAEPKIQSRRELRRFKQLMETGEVSTAQAPDAAPRAE